MENKLNQMSLTSFIKNPKKYIEKKIKNRVSVIINKKNLLNINDANENDFYIIGYPKSGNTWFQHIMSSLLFGLNPEQIPDKLVQDLVPDLMAKIHFKRYLNYAVFKSHEKPKPKHQKVIYLIRDGRDVVVSYYHYKNKVVNKKLSLREIIVEGKGLVPNGCKWHEHVEAWSSNPYNAQIIFIKYEDMLINPYQELQRVCNFIGIKRDTKSINQVIIGNSFEKMKNKQKENGWEHMRTFTNSNNFFRQGKSGAYKTELPKDLERHFTKESFEMLRKFNYI